MTRFAPVVAAVAAAVLFAPVFAAPVPKAIRAQGDHDTIVGDWREVTADPSGTPTDTPTGYTWRFEPGGTAQVVWPDGTVVTAVYALDPAGSPKGFEWTLPRHAARFVGVYEVTADTLRTATTSGGRPPAGELRPAPQVEYRTYVRVKPSR